MWAGLLCGVSPSRPTLLLPPGLGRSCSLSRNAFAAPPVRRHALACRHALPQVQDDDPNAKLVADADIEALLNRYAFLYSCYKLHSTSEDKV